MKSRCELATSVVVIDSDATMSAALHARQPSSDEYPPSAVAKSSLDILLQARSDARAWSNSLREDRRQTAIQSFVETAIETFTKSLSRNGRRQAPLSSQSMSHGPVVEARAAELARVIGREAAKLPLIQATYQLSATYAALLPTAVRSAGGVYYTPPALTERLMEMAEAANVDWRTARVLDPACGGGAFLVPVALKMRGKIAAEEPGAQLACLAARLKGFEIDPFAAWMTQALLEVALGDLLTAYGKSAPQFVRVCDALELDDQEGLFDLVIGNPPYGRLSLAAERRARFARSLYGHANLYGLFADAALRWVKPGGVIAYVTPTSFLSGEYFKALRSLLAEEAPPDAIEFVDARRGVFEDVLQEALLATYRRNGPINGTTVHCLSVKSEVAASSIPAGHFSVSSTPAAPWIVPRLASHQRLVDRLGRMSDRLCHWGYEVSTGPLVWNRHKPQLRSHPGPDSFPLIWAEAVTADGFAHRSAKRNHQPYFKTNGPADDWLKVTLPCVLLQRTTAKEQSRRLIAAVLPAAFIRKNHAVIVENHLNMIRRINGKAPSVAPAALAALLNSEIADEAFRCMSGSVAVSAFELEALPLPPIARMAEIEALIRDGASSYAIESRFRSLYMEDQRK